MNTSYRHTIFKYWWSARGPNPILMKAGERHGKVSYLYKDMKGVLAEQYPLRKIHGPIPTRAWFVGKTFIRPREANAEE